MSYNFFIKPLLLSIVFMGITVNSVLAIQDGFEGGKTLQSHYFTISYPETLNNENLLSRLNFVPDQEWLLNSSFDEEISFTGLNGTLDALFIRVSSILDMYLYSFKGNIKICSDHDQLKQIFQNLYQTNNIPDTGYSFYIHELKTIYISQEYFTKEILAHEMAHAVISHYFVVQPSAKVQEVLAGYIEFQIRKSR